MSISTTEHSTRGSADPRPTSAIDADVAKAQADGSRLHGEIREREEERVRLRRRLDRIAGEAELEGKPAPHAVEQLEEQLEVVGKAIASKRGAIGLLEEKLEHLAAERAAASDVEKRAAIASILEGSDPARLRTMHAIADLQSALANEYELEAALADAGGRRPDPATAINRYGRGVVLGGAFSDVWDALQRLALTLSQGPAVQGVRIRMTDRGFELVKPK